MKKDIKIINKSPLFDKTWYLNNNPDIKNSHIDPAAHYYQFGWKEGRDPSSRFHTNEYLSLYPDVKNENICPLVHYEKYGKKEGRKLSFSSLLLPSAVSPVWKREVFPFLKNKMPMVSVIVTICKHYNYIEKTLQSLIEQRYKNFEIIIISSSDTECCNTIKRYVNMYSFIYWYQYPRQGNKRLLKAIQLGISKSKGDYIAFCENGDLWTPEYLLKKINIINQHPSVSLITNDCECICDDIILKYKTENTIVLRNKNAFDKPLKQFSFEEFRSTNYITTFSCCMVKKNILSKCDFNSPRKAALDWWLWRQIAITHPIYFLNEKLTIWRIHQSYLENSSAEKQQFYQDFINKMDELLHKKHFIFFLFHKNRKKQIASNNSNIKDISFFNQALYPLNRKLKVVVDNKVRPVSVNILIPSIRPKLSAGPLSIIWFGKFLTDLGFHVRFITYLNWVNGDIPSIIDNLEPELNGYGHKTEVECIIKDGYELKINSNDMTIATLWSSAYIAEKIQSFCYNKKFIYLIQDYEPSFYSASSHFMLSEATYLKNYNALFSTQALYDYFIQCNIGNLAHRHVNTYIYKTPANSYLCDKKTFINLHKKATKKRFVFYCRPHIDRNAYELACLVIIKAVELGVFSPDEWEFFGIGAAFSENIKLAPGVMLEQIPNMPLEDYKKLLPTFDLALSLMASPHPSMPPFDFALSGSIVVTNESDIKNQKYFASICKNIISAEATIEGLLHGLKLAIDRVSNLDARYKNAVQSSYPINWKQVFNKEFAQWFNHILNKRN